MTLQNQDQHDGPRTAKVRGPSSSLLDATALRLLERKRRDVQRIYGRQPLPTSYLARVTRSSFAMEGITLSDDDLLSAQASRSMTRAPRRPQLLRVRNHIAILRHIHKIVRIRAELRLPTVVRWYTSISCGLSIAAVDLSRVDQLESHLRRLNASPLRLRQALVEAASLHLQLLNNPLFPGFNGILARLLLQYQLGRCHFPPVIVDEFDKRALESETTLAQTLAESISSSCDRLTTP